MFPALRFVPPLVWYVGMGDTVRVVFSIPQAQLVRRINLRLVHRGKCICSLALVRYKQERLEPCPRHLVIRSPHVVYSVVDEPGVLSTALQPVLVHAYQCRK